MPTQSPLRVRVLVAALALSALPLAARAIEVPDSAVTADTMLMAWVDLGVGEQLMQGLPAFAAGMKPAQKADMEKKIKAFVKYHQEFKELGVEGLLIGLSQPAKGADKPAEKMEPFLLLKTKAGADRAKFEKLLHSMADQAEGQQQQTAVLATKIEKYGTSTVWHAITGESLVFPPLNGNVKDAAVFNAAFKGVEKSTFQLCFRMLPALKAEVQAKVDEQAKNPNAGGDMLITMTSGMMEPLTKLDLIVASGDMVKDAKQVGVTLHFADAASAAAFTTSFNGLVDMGKGLVGMQMAQMAKYGVDTKNVNDIIGQVALKADQNDAGLKLDNAFFSKCETLMAQIQAAQEKMHGPAAGGDSKVVNVDADDDDGDDTAAKAVDKAQAPAPAK